MSKLREDGRLTSRSQQQLQPSPSSESRRRAAQAMDPRDRAPASNRLEQDTLDMARAAGRKRGLAQGKGALVGRRGTADGNKRGPVWLTTRDRHYVDYFRRIHSRIHPRWRFPKRLEILMEQGEVLVEFGLESDGRVNYVRIRRSSGFPDFDANAVAAIWSAGPFEPVPRVLGRSLRIVAPFEFANPLVR